MPRSVPRASGCGRNSTIEERNQSRLPFPPFVIGDSLRQVLPSGRCARSPVVRHPRDWPRGRCSRILFLPPPPPVFSHDDAFAGCKADAGRRTPNHPPSLPATVLANHVHCFRKPSCDLGNREALPRRLRRYPVPPTRVSVPLEADAVDQVQDLAHLPCSLPGGHHDAYESTRSPTILRRSQVRMLTEGASQVFWDSSVPGRPCASGP